ncbi:hypothetical protein GCM10025767_13830 [Thalassotalea piscium]
MGVYIRLNVAIGEIKHTMSAIAAHKYLNCGFLYEVIDSKHFNTSAIRHPCHKKCSRVNARL